MGHVERIERIWYISSECHSNDEHYIWDSGNEQWEYKNGIITHYRIIQRVMNKEETEVKETIELLPESLIPAHIYLRNSIGTSKWRIKECKKPLMEVHTQRSDIKCSQSEISWDWTSLSSWIPPNILYQERRICEMVE